MIGRTEYVGLLGRVVASGQSAEFFASGSWQEFSVRCRASGAAPFVSEPEFERLKDKTAGNMKTSFGRVSLRRTLVWLERKAQLEAEP